MFFDIVTKRGEQVSINLDNVLYITPNKRNGTVIMDVNGMEYEIGKPYEEFKKEIFGKTYPVYTEK